MLPSALLEGLTRSWQRAQRSGRAQCFVHEFTCLCARYGDGDPEPAQAPPQNSPEHANRENTHIDVLPDDLLARILRLTLDPEHPGSLCSSSYLSGLPTTPELRMDGRYHQLPFLPEYFSRKALIDRSPAGPLPSILVSKRWRNVVMRCDVVCVLAANAPSGLPCSLQTLILRLAPSACMSQSQGRAEGGLVRALSSPEGFPHLKELVCGSPVYPGHDQLPSEIWLGRVLDALSAASSSISGLTRLFISRCKVPLSAAHGPDSALGRMTDLRSLSLIQDFLRDEEVQNVVACFGSLTKLTHFEFSRNPMSPVGFKHLVAGITQLPELRSLQLQNIPPDGPRYNQDDQHTLCEYLAGLSGLQHLEVQRDVLAGVDLAKALPAFLQCAALHTLSLHIRTAAREQVEVALPAFAQSAALRVLDLHLGTAARKGAAIIFSNLPHMHELRELKLDGFRGDPTEALPQLAPDSPAVPLRSLAVYNGVSAAFLATLAPRISLLSSLTALALQHQNWTDSEQMSFASCLPGLSGLQALNITATHLDENVLEALACSATCLTALRFLSLSSTGLMAYQCGTLTCMLEPLTKLTALDLDNDSLDGEGVEELVPVLGTLHQLQELRLPRFSRPSGMLAIVPCLSKWPAMARLDVSDFLGGEEHFGDFEMEDGDACMLLLAAHIADEDRLAMLDLGTRMSKIVQEGWRRLRDIWKASVSAY